MLKTVLSLLLFVFVATNVSGQYPYADLIRAHSHKNGLEPALVAAVMYTESRFNPASHSHTGAVGLMQVQPATYAYICKLTKTKPGNLWAPSENIRAGVWYLGFLIRKYGDEHRALEAYFGGHKQTKHTAAYARRVTKQREVYQNGNKRK